MREERYGECSSCRATGVYRGTMEPEGIGVICSLCGGTGRVQSSILKLFSVRRMRNDITTMFSRLTEKRGVYAGKGISYQAFLGGIMPDEEETTQVK